MRPMCCLLVCCLATAGGAKPAAAIDLLVPAYANPCCAGGPKLWSALIATARDRSRKFELYVILNPASGPALKRDPNYLDDKGQGPLNDFRQAGGKTCGYVATGYGRRSLAKVKADIDAYLCGHYAGYVDGIFLDEISNDLADVAYYRELHRHVQAQQAGALTFGNPGTGYTNNPSEQAEFSAVDYIECLDTIVSFENTAAAYRDKYTAFPYLEKLSPKKIGHIIHSQADWDAKLLNTAAERGAGWLYISDDKMPPDNNPYNELPSYWSQLTSDLSDFNRTQK